MRQTSFNATDMMIPLKYVICLLLSFTLSACIAGCAAGAAAASEREKEVFAGTAEKYSIRVALRALAPSEMETPSGGDVAATHRVTVAVSDTVAGTAVLDAEVWFHIIYPSGRNLMPQLPARRDVFEQDVPLSEKGSYTFMVHVIREDETPEVTFTLNLE